MIFPFRNVRDVLGLHAKVSSRKVAVISYDAHQNRQELTYLEFVGKAHQVANFIFEDLQIKRGDTIAIISPNHENALLLYFAAWVIGATVVAIDAAADDSTIQHMLTDSAPQILFADHSLLEKVQPIVSEIKSVEGIIQIGGEQREDVLRFEDLAANRPTTFLGDESGAKGADVPMTGGNERTARLTDIALITYTNGHKLSQTQGDLLENATHYAHVTALTGNQVTLSPLAIHHRFTQAILAPLTAGATLILTETFTPDDFWHYLVDNHAHTATLSAELITEMVSVARTHIENGDMRCGGKIIQQDIKHLRFITVIDPTLTSQQIRDFEDTFGVPVITGFEHPMTGQLLTLLPITLAWDHHQRILHGSDLPSIGVPLSPLVVTTQQGRLAENGEVGTICFQREEKYLPIHAQGYAIDDRGHQFFYLA